LGATVPGERLRRLKKSGAEEVYEDVTLRHLLETTVMILSSADADVASHPHKVLALCGAGHLT
jgi:hypothetical protein